MEKKVCFKCNEEYIPTSYNQRFCGSKLQKIGCSWLNYKDLQKKWEVRSNRYPARNEKRRDYLRNWCKNWRLKRKLTTPTKGTQ